MTPAGRHSAGESTPRHRPCHFHGDQCPVPEHGRRLVRRSVVPAGLPPLPPDQGRGAVARWLARQATCLPTPRYKERGPPRRIRCPAPDAAETHQHLAMARAAQGRFEEAVTGYREALRLRPDFAEAHNNLGTLLLSHGRLGEAEAEFRQALRVRPDFVEAHSNLGNTYA